jgi:polysaccharide export outer membrane protein
MHSNHQHRDFIAANPLAKMGAIMRKLFYFFILALTVFTLPAHAKDYKLGVGDVVHITVYDHPDLLVEAAQVDEDGNLSMPLIGATAVAGLTTSGAQKKIASALEKGGFVINPHVNLIVQQYRSKQISVLGQVNKPGKYALEFTSTLADLLALAGGIGPLGSDNVILIHKVDGKLQQTSINTLSLFKGGKLDLNYTIADDDILYVPRAEVFYIYGEVQKPGAYRVEKNMNVMQAISLGGGITIRGTQRGVQIRRGDDNGKPIVIPADPMATIQPDDVIYIKESLF